MNGDVFRILDANLNRAREALRVIEEYCRFVQGDQAGAAAVKRLRHDLAALGSTLPAGGLLAARDVAGDVGRETKTPDELARGAADEVAAAEFARLGEALRVLGEYGKLISVDFPAGAERVRYRAYELEPLVRLRGAARGRMARARLYVLLTESLCRRPWLETARQVLRAGVDVLQLREKQLPDGELLDRAVRLRNLCAEHGALFVVNDRPDIARLAGADGLHVGQEDLAVREARRAAGGGILIGKSTHDREQFDAAAAEEPDYLAIGPMYETSTKPQSRVAGPALLAELAARTALPLVAIGGITPGRVGELRAAGGGCLAVCGAVISAEDPAAAVRAFRAALGGTGG